MTSWVRLWLDMPTDPKWRVIAKKSGQPLPCVIALYTLLLSVAGGAVRPGTISDMSIEDAAAALDMDEDAVSSILSAMEGRVILSGRLSGWEKRQPKREDDSSQRVREHRARAKQETKRNVTQCNAPEAEAEADTEAAKAARKSAESDTEIQRVVGTAYRAARAAGCCSPDQRKIIENQTIVRQWIAAGATHDGIIALIEERMAGASITPRSLRYFDAAIRESLAPAKPVRSRQEAEALALADRILSRPQEPRRAAG